MNDELLFKDLDYFDSLSVPYCLFNNTLLSIYRDKKPFPSDARQCVVLLPHTCWSMFFGSPKKIFANKSLSGYGAIDLQDKICINFYYKKNDKIVINPAEGNFFVLDCDVILPYASLVYKDRSIPIPHDLERYLSLYYGDWGHPIPDHEWNWVWSKRIVHANSIDEAIIEQQRIDTKHA